MPPTPHDSPILPAPERGGPTKVHSGQDAESNRLSNRVRLGDSDLLVSRIGLGCWPMSGISSIGVTDEQSIATIQTAMDCGVPFFDTAYSYGYDGRSDRVLEQALRGHRKSAVIAHKVGSHWDSERKRCIDGSPKRLLSQAEECLKRLKTDYVDVMYLHTPDPNTPIEESAGAITEICKRGWARYAAVSNVDAEQAERFIAVCPVIAFQPYFNMFQQDAVEKLRATAARCNIGMVCYWILMKGLLAGRFKRDHVFDPTDRRLTYPIFQGEAWQRAQDLLDRLRMIAFELDCTVAQLVTAWSLRQPGVTVALVGARTPEQMIESAGSLNLQLDVNIVSQIDALLQHQSLFA
jgi:aryl-alcohol dehydrogenase-like predicted oxidoreductase